MFPKFVLFIIVSILIHGSYSQRKLVCLDSKNDVDTAGWKFNTEVKSVPNAQALPKAFGDLKSLEGNGIFYVEGPTSGTAKDITFRSASTLYTSRAKNVNIYIKYYDNSPRRNSLFPVKSTTGSSGGPLQLLPVSTPSKWTEIRKEIDPNESPIELTGLLGANQYILFEKIVLTVDSPLPSDLSMSCQQLTTIPTISTPVPTLGTTRKPFAQPSTPAALDISTRSDCPVLPTIPECKCNCLCNCAKC